MLALVQAHSNNSDTGFDDIINGKGKGPVLLLHSAPGVGETLTAGNNLNINVLRKDR